MADLNVLKKLERWYEDQCDGLWEHGWGITIKTLDNPGWSVEINLRETAHTGLPEREVNVETSETDWAHCRIKDQKFNGYGDPTKLSRLIEVFFEWIEKE